ncbi:10807_t:CDS:2 [Cetraspora pellucida]|uniref:10807_t:CDS:1 n=1 Tax=Cetraspora pellucida TaxID=1433469 RepID=A0ACA9KEB1_9GLOM|nr:10807_t:CDS:2 [Cetraspora pellucida]
MSQNSKNKIASSSEKSLSLTGKHSEEMSNYLLNFNEQGPTSIQDISYQKNINSILKNITQAFWNAATERHITRNCLSEQCQNPRRPHVNRILQQSRDVNYCKLYDNEAEEEVYVSTQHHHQPYTTNRKERLKKRTKEPRLEEQPTQPIHLEEICEKQTSAQHQQIDELLEAFEKAKWFSSLDLFTIFQRAMNEILQEYIRKCIVVYLDNINVYLTTLYEYFEHLKKILSAIQEAKLKVNPEKCQLFRTNIRFLGHIVEEDSVKPDDKKIAKVKNFSTPRSLKQLWGFIRLASYYRCFIQSFVTITKPLYQLLEKGVKYE